MKEKIKVGTLWIYLPTSFEIKAHDIICKVIRVTDTHVYVIRKSNFGFKDLDPLIISFQVFLDYYMYLSECED